MNNNSFELLIERLINRKLIIFGCGRYFQLFCKRFPELVSKIAFIIDNAPEKQNYEIKMVCGDKTIGIPVRPISDMFYQIQDSFVILFCAAHWQEMKMQLDEILKYDYIRFTMPLEVDYIKNKERAYRDRVIIPIIDVLEKNCCLNTAIQLTGQATKQNLVQVMEKKQIVAISRMPIILTPACSLKCKDCNNLMWAFEQPNELNGERIIQSLKNIIDSVSFVGCFELIGGEPFLSKNLDQVLSFLIEQKKVLSIEITTNATVLPKVATISLLQRENINVRISNYGKIVNQKPFIIEMKKNHINCEVLAMERWISPGGVEKRNRTAKSLLQQYYSCTAGYWCKTLWEDRVYPCARAASLAKLGIYDNCPYIDASSIENLSAKLMEFYVVPSCGSCDYCDIKSGGEKVVEPAIQRR